MVATTPGLGGCFRPIPRSLNNPEIKIGSVGGHALGLCRAKKKNLPIGMGGGCENYIGNIFFKKKSKNLSGAENLAKNGLKLPSKHLF